MLATLTLLAVFVAGGVVGAAVERARAPELPPAAAESGPRGAMRPPIFAGGPMAERLGLTPAQRDSIRGIVERDRARADTLYREFRPRLRARYDSTAAAVEAVLTPEQRAEWRRIREERRPRWRGEGAPPEGWRERAPRRERRAPAPEAGERGVQL